MTHSYMISVKLQPDQWSGSAVTQELYVQSNTPNLGVLLRTLDASPTVVGIRVFRTITIPPLTRLQQMKREDMEIQEKDMEKVS